VNGLAISTEFFKIAYAAADPMCPCFLPFASKLTFGGTA